MTILGTKLQIEWSGQKTCVEMPGDFEARIQAGGNIVLPS